MSRRLLVLLVLPLLLVLPGGRALAAAEPPARCFVADETGRLPTCTWDGDSWQRSYEGLDPLLPGAGGSAGAAFAGLVLLVLLLGLAGVAWRVSTARRMARGAGLSERDATTMALVSDEGFEATYLASSLRTPPPAPTPSPGADPATRLRQLEELRVQELISLAEYDARRQAVIDSV